MKRTITLRDLYILLMNDELPNEIITFNPQIKHFTLSEKKLSDIYDNGTIFGENNFDSQLLACYVKWFIYDTVDKKIVICLVYEKWMEKYDTTRKDG